MVIFVSLNVLGGLFVFNDFNVGRIVCSVCSKNVVLIVFLNLLVLNMISNRFDYFFSSLSLIV